MRTMLSNIVSEISKFCPDVSNRIITNLPCTDCSKKAFGEAETDCFVNLETHKLNEDLTILLNKFEENLLTSHKQTCAGQNLSLHQNSNILLLSGGTGMRLRLSKPIKFLGKSFRCKAVITTTGSYFSSDDLWYQVCDETINHFHGESLSDVIMVAFEENSEDFYKNEDSIIYQGADYQKIIQIGDRHKVTPKRKEDRHKDNADRHKVTPKRKEDRHQDPTKDRHQDPTKDRHQDPTKDRHQNKSFRGKSQAWDTLKKDINDDTGMDVICCSCLEMKSKKSCVSAATLSSKLVSKYCFRQEISRSVDGKFYVCLTCQISIKSDRKPTRALKELFGFLDFPEGNK